MALCALEGDESVCTNLANRATKHRLPSSCCVSILELCQLGTRCSLSDSRSRAYGGIVAHNDENAPGVGTFVQVI